MNEWDPEEGDWLDWQLPIIIEQFHHAKVALIWHTHMDNGGSVTDFPGVLLHPPACNASPAGVIEPRENR